VEKNSPCLQAAADVTRLLWSALDSVDKSFLVRKMSGSYQMFFRSNIQHDNNQQSNRPQSVCAKLFLVMLSSGQKTLVTHKPLGAALLVAQFGHGF